MKLMQRINTFSMVIILDGISEIGAHMWTALGLVICARRLDGVQTQNFLQK